MEFNDVQKLLVSESVNADMRTVYMRFIAFEI